MGMLYIKHNWRFIPQQDFLKVKAKKEVVKQENKVVKQTEVVKEVEVKDERAVLFAEYNELFGKKPVPNIKTETLKEKIKKAREEV